MKTYLLLISLLITGLLSAQSEECGTVITQEQLDYLNETYAARLASPELKSMATINVPVVNHVLRESDGTGGLTTADIAGAMDELNVFYSQAEADIQFFECQPIDFIDSDNLFNNDFDTENDLYGDYDIENVLNIYYVNDIINVDNGRQYCGYAYPPSLLTDRIVMRNECVFNGSTLIHEVGHYFSLAHTHGNYPRCGGTYERVVRTGNDANCNTAADGLCDTPADPNLRYQNDDCGTENYSVNGNCEYTGTFTDANGDSYNPLTDNIMSYSRRECRNTMTTGQLNRVRYSAVNQRSYLNSDCQIQCTQGATCDDNDPCTTGDVYDENCLCVGTFADSDTDGICNAEDSCPDLNNDLIGTACNDDDVCTVDDIYTTDCGCVGTFDDTDGDGICDAEDICPNDPDTTCTTPEYCEAEGADTNYEFIQSVELNGQNNNSGHSGGYGDFRATILTTLIGTNTIILTPGFGGTARDLNWVVWIDFNKDGDFTDVGEEVFSGKSLGDTPLTGTFTNPSGTGTTVMRVATRRSVIPSSCGLFLHGEVEDYTVELADVAPEYCESEGRNTNYEFIQSVELNGQNNDSGDNGGYADFTANTLAVIGNANTIVLTPGFDDNAYNENWVVWIDFNRDGDFTDAGEEVFSGESLGNTPLIATFTAPASTGTTVMRVSMDYSGGQNSCSSFTNGEVEDYTVELTDGPACTQGSECDDNDS